MPLFPTAPMMPDTCVPWPLSSFTLLLLPTQFQPWMSSNRLLNVSCSVTGSTCGLVQMLAARSG